MCLIYAWDFVMCFIEDKVVNCGFLLPVLHRWRHHSPLVPRDSVMRTVTASPYRYSVSLQTCCCQPLYITYFRQKYLALLVFNLKLRITTTAVTDLPNKQGISSTACHVLLIPVVPLPQFEKHCLRPSVGKRLDSRATIVQKLNREGQVRSR